MKSFVASGVSAIALMTSRAMADCCGDLTAAISTTSLANQLFTSTSANYTALNNARWSNTEILSPSCIFAPQSADEVSTVIQLLTASNCSFAIKSGGHMAKPGANNIDGGVSIDLSHLNSVSVNSDKSVVSLGAGGTWLNAYTQIAGQGIGIPGGLCGTTGVGGVSIGGGQSIFSAAKGWVIDSIVNFQVVLASGAVVDANATSNVDLFRALKGGGNNFGVVTRVDVAAFAWDQTVFGGQIIVPAVEPLVGAALSATLNYTVVNNEHTADALQTVFFYLANGTQVIDLALVNTANDAASPGLAPFLAMGPQARNTVAAGRPLVDFIEEIIPTQPHGYRDLWAMVTFAVPDAADKDTILAVHNITNTIYKKAKAAVPDMDWIFFYNPWPKSVETHAAASGGNVLGLEDQGKDQIMVQIAPRWTDAQYDEAMYGFAQEWTAEVAAATERMGTKDDFLYLNFAGQWQKPLCSYGADNVAFLERVSAAYDPNGVFQTLVPGGFKVRNAC